MSGRSAAGCILIRARIVATAAAAALASGAAGCGYSEDEMQAKIHQIDELRTQVSAEQEQRRKATGEIAEQAAKIEQLKQELKAAGVDLSHLNDNLELQARALEDYRRRAEQLQALKRRFEGLREKLQPLSRLGVVVTVRHNRVVIQLPGDAIFDAGHETLKKEAEPILLKVAEVLRDDAGLAARGFQVAGHTDGEPIPSGRFKDDWAFSLLRAREVLAFLVAPSASKGAPSKGAPGKAGAAPGARGGGLDAQKTSAAGFGAADPLKPNDSPEGKQANRRCEIVIAPSDEELLDLKSLTP